MQRPRPGHLLAAGAFVLGCARGAASPMTSDAGFHLLRAGNSLLTGSLDAYRVAPGGEHAPLLGAAATAFGALFAGSGGEAAQLLPGCALLGAAAAVVLLALRGTVEHAAVLLGVALLLLPPAVVSSFPYRPDAALAGVLLVAALHARWQRRSPLSVSLPAWLATLAAPWALPAAVVLLLADARRARAWIAPAATAALVFGASMMLGDVARGQIVRGLFGEVTFRFDPAGAAAALRVVWGGGLIFLAPILLPLVVRDVRPPRAVAIAFAASAVFLLLAADPVAFRAGAAALLPSAAYLCARIAHAFPDARSPAPPRRPVLFALLLPLLLLLLTGADDAAERAAVRGPTAREAQIATFLRDDWKNPGDVLASRTGALAALSRRTVRRIPKGGGLGDPLPDVIVLGGGLAPAGPDERAVFLHPDFLASYTPLEFHRGRGHEFRDAVWVKLGRSEPDEVRVAYGESLLDGWSRDSAGEPEAARDLYLDAIREEPFGRARARESLGLLYERVGQPEAAERTFRAARSRDPYAVWARGHLIDRAIAHGGILRADSLLAEAMRFNPFLPELRATRARLFSRAGLGVEAIAEAEASVQLDPTNGRILANWGIYLWRAGSFEEARAAWRRAVRADAAMLRYLGDFESAATTVPPPPPLPLFTDVDFDPLHWRRDAKRDPGAASPDAAPGETPPGDGG